MEQPALIISFIVAIVLILILVLLLVKQNKSGFTNDKITGASQAMGKGMGMGIAIGMGIGLAIGISMDNIPIGIAIGLGIGVSIGVAMGSGYKSKVEEQHFLNKKERSYHQTQNARMPLIVGLIAVMLGILMLGLIFFMKVN